MGKNVVKFSLFAELEGLLAAEFDFLGKAVCKDETRFFMEWIIVEPVDAEDSTKGLCAVSTDGRRLHIVEPLHKSVEIYGITAGHYKVVKSGRTATQIARVADECEKDCGKFPDWRRAMPEGEPVKILNFGGFTLKSDPRSSVLFSEAIRFFRDFPEPVGFNPQFLADLPLGFPWKCHYWEPHKGVKFTVNNLTAVIMPMMMD